MELPDEVIDDVRNRLHRVSGQLAGIERMLDNGRECKDVVTQISAATKALEQSRLQARLRRAHLLPRQPRRSRSDWLPLDVVEKMFMKLA